MAVTYLNSLKDTRMTAVITALDGQAGNAAIQIWNAAYATMLCSIPLAKPSFTEATQAITMAGGSKSGTAVASGTAALGRIVDGAGSPNNIITGLTVAAGSGDINLNSVSITNGQTVTITSAVITHG
jgi:hypothetical protein